MSDVLEQFMAEVKIDFSYSGVTYQGARLRKADFFEHLFPQLQAIPELAHFKSYELFYSSVYDIGVKKKELKRLEKEEKIAQAEEERKKRLAKRTAKEIAEAERLEKLQKQMQIQLEKFQVRPEHIKAVTEGMVGLNVTTDALYFLDIQGGVYFPVTTSSMKKWAAMTRECEVEDLVAMATPVDETFNPTNASRILFPDNFSHISASYAINTYCPPEWRSYKGELPNELPVEVDEFLTHLFPKESHKHYALCWIHHMLTSRNQTMLVLIGNKGVGKNIFVDALCTALVGQRYSNKAGESFLTEKFNHEMDGKQLLSMDEVCVKEEFLNTLKRISNDTVSIESKGVNARHSKNTANFIVTSNLFDSFQAETSDRRFSVPEITTVPLVKLWPESKIASFLHRLDKDVAFVAQIGNYILKYDTGDNTPFTALKDANFYELSMSAAKEWQNFIFELITGRKEAFYSLGDLKNRWRVHMGIKSDVPENRTGFPLSAKAIQKWLGSFLYPDQDGKMLPIGKMEKRVNPKLNKEDWFLVPSSQYSVVENAVALIAAKPGELSYAQRVALGLEDSDDEEEAVGTIGVAMDNEISSEALADL